MEYIAMGVTVAVLAAASYRGYKAGIVRMILYIAALLITVTASAIFMKPVSEALKNNTSLYSNIEKSVEKAIKEYEITDIQAVGELPFPDYMLEEAGQIKNASSSVADAVAGAIALQIFEALVYIGLNILIYIVIRVAMGALNVITMLPIVKEANKLAGLLVGFFEGVIVLWLICLLLQACGSEAWAQEIFVQIKENDFLSWIYNHNLLRGFVSRLM